MSDRIEFNLEDFIYEDGQLRFKLTDAKVDMFNQGIENLANEAKEIAVSHSFERIADGWEDPEFQYGVDGLISEIEIANNADAEGSFGIDNLFDLMDTGREGGVLIEPVSKKMLTVFYDRYRTDFVLSESVIQGEIVAPKPVDHALEALSNGVETFISELRESRWGSNRTTKRYSKTEGKVVTIVKPRKLVKALPSLYPSYYKDAGKTTPKGMKTNKGSYGNYGGGYRENKQYSGRSYLQ